MTSKRHVPVFALLCAAAAVTGTVAHADSPCATAGPAATAAPASPCTTAAPVVPTTTPKPAVLCNSFTCDGKKDWLAEVSKDNVPCVADKCTDEQCCVQKCNSVICGKDFLSKDSNTVCVGKCDTDKCCDKQPKCNTYDCDSPCATTGVTPAAGTWTLKPKPEGILCKGLICDKDECCEPPVKCSSFKCDATKDWVANEAKTGTICKDRTCTEEQCCVQKCESVTCGSGFLSKDNSTVCVGECDSDQCCDKLPTCNAYDCDSDSPCATTVVAHQAGDWTLKPKPEDITCKALSCKKNECCEPPVKCSSFKCDATKDWLPDGAKNGTTCKDRTCTDEQCCLQKCESVTCGKEFLSKDNTTVCVGECDSDECCDKLPTCNGHSCDAAWTPKPAPKNITCKGLTCKQDECCEPPVRCENMTCVGANWFPEPKNAKHICKGRVCTDEQCCIQKCESVTCAKGFLRKDNDTVCIGDCKNPVNSLDQCCDKLPTCNAFECGGDDGPCATTAKAVLPGDWTLISKPQDHTCKGLACTKAECCEPPLRCENMTCAGANWLLNPANAQHICKDRTCTDEKCCIQKCESITCGKDMFNKGNDTVCVGECDMDQCCIEDPTCAGFNCADSPCATTGSAGPGDWLLISKPEDHTCPNKTCTKKECCEPPVKCSSFTCNKTGDWLPDGSKNTSICKDQTCTDRQCCIQECSSVTCAKGSLAKIGSTVCVGKCDTDQCCDELPTCKAFSCSDSVGDWTLKAKPEDITCQSLTCNKTECCLPPVKCNSFKCNALQNWVSVTAKNDTICKDRTCSDEQCCVQKCSSITCGGGFLAKPGSTECVGKCDKDQCCDKLPTCEAFTCSDSPCATTDVLVPGDWTLKDKPDKITCDALQCNKTECCEPPVKCSSFTCDAKKDWVTGETKNNTICKDRDCTDEQCCVQKCKSVTCGKGFLSKGENTTCVGKCDVDKCCDELPKCTGFPCNVQMGWTLKPKPEDTTCKALTCNNTECCLPPVHCSTHTCGKDWFNNTAKAKVICNGRKCTDDQCCSEKCKSFTCGPGFKSKADTTLCAGKCTAPECCDLEQTCANSGITCAGVCATVGDNSLMKAKPETIMCPPGGCTSDTCCDKPVASTTDNPCAPTVQRLYSDKQEVAAQTKRKEVGQALGVMPALGMFAMCALVSGVGAFIYKRRVRSTRQLTLLSQDDSLEGGDFSDSLAIE